MDFAYAMGGAGGGTPGGDMQFIVMMAVVFLIFYFLLIRPQQKKQKELKEMLSNIKHGDTVVTAGGLYGKVTGLTDSVVTLEIADKVRVKVSRGHISAVAQKAEKEE
ncbi:MAG: preprotein translocase subunit YajC [Syntrophales bacterium]